MGRPSLLEQANRAERGAVHRKLRAWVRADLPASEMTYRLRTQHGLTVDPATVNRYLKRLGLR